MNEIAKSFLDMETDKLEEQHKAYAEMIALYAQDNDIGAMVRHNLTEDGDVEHMFSYFVRASKKDYIKSYATRIYCSYWNARAAASTLKAMLKILQNENSGE